MNQDPPKKQNGLKLTRPQAESILAEVEIQFIHKKLSGLHIDSFRSLFFARLQDLNVPFNERLYWGRRLLSLNGRAQQAIYNRLGPINSEQEKRFVGIEDPD